MLRIVDEHVRANTYLVETTRPGEVVVIDPGLDWEAIQSALESRSLRPVAIACTHGHFDHVGSAHQLQREYGAPVYLHRDDAKVLRSANFLLMACRIDRRITVPAIDVFVDDGATVDVAGDTLRFIHTPGHTPGSCLIQFRGSVFTGDTLYRDGIGLVEFPGEDKRTLRDSLIKVIDRLDRDLLVCPGHGGSAPLAEIMESNLDLREFLALDAGPAA